MKPEDCQNSSVSINLVDKNLFKNEFIGRYDMDWQTVYFTDKNMLEHQWLALSNPESEDYQEIKGMLKMSIAVRGPGDEPYPLNPQIGDKEVSQVLMPT
jgi:hypothetical protein